MVDSEKGATGIIKLDKLLTGGLLRRRGYLILGPPHSGKTTLAMQILYAALQRGEPCTYISYSATYREVLRYFKSCSWDVTPYMESNRLRIIDHYSVGINGSPEQLEADLRDVERRTVYFVDRKIDNNSYVALYLKIRREIGYGGVSIIDDISDLVEYLGVKKARERQERCRRQFAQRGGVIGLHVLTPAKDHEDFADYLQRMEDATFELTKDEKRWFIGLHLRSMDVEKKWYELEARKGKIIVVKEHDQPPSKLLKYEKMMQGLLEQQKLKKIYALAEDRRQLSELGIDANTKRVLIQKVEKVQSLVKEVKSLKDLEELWQEYQKAMRDLGAGAYSQ